jgi:hypothetical protein
MGSRFLRPDPGEFPLRRRADLPRNHHQLRALGRHRRIRPRTSHHFRRTRLQRNSAQEASPDPSGQVHRTRRFTSLLRRYTRRQRAQLIWSGRRRPDRRGGRDQQRHPTEIRRILPARPRRTHGTIHVARHNTTVRRIYFLLRRQRARSIPGTLLQVRREDIDVHRRMR